jgi:hypothetical protein|tara:strand:- start:327 stop:596 length:270 start_codon:yes stop_codon:yes gene_type:complete
MGHSFEAGRHLKKKHLSKNYKSISLPDKQVIVTMTFTINAKHHIQNALAENDNSCENDKEYLWFTRVFVGNFTARKQRHDKQSCMSGTL